MGQKVVRHSLAKKRTQVLIHLNLSKLRSITLEFLGSGF